MSGYGSRAPVLPGGHCATCDAKRCANPRPVSEFADVLLLAHGKKPEPLQGLNLCSKCWSKCRNYRARKLGGAKPQPSLPAAGALESLRPEMQQPAAMNSEPELVLNLKPDPPAAPATGFLPLYLHRCSAELAEQGIYSIADLQNSLATNLSLRTHYEAYVLAVQQQILLHQDHFLRNGEAQQIGGPMRTDNDKEAAAVQPVPKSDKDVKMDSPSTVLGPRTRRPSLHYENHLTGNDANLALDLQVVANARRQREAEVVLALVHLHGWRE